jgi:hypothetical protein
MDLQETAVVAKVGRPPLLRVGHDGSDVLLQCIVVELLELLGVVEVGQHRVLARVVLAENAELELIWPPVLVLGAAACDIGRPHGALAFGHDCCSRKGTCGE